MDITVGIPTKGRYDVLHLCLLSLAFQTLKPKEVIIVDDSDHPRILTDIPEYLYIFQLFEQYKIQWRVLFGQKKGQHHSHQMVQDEARTEWIFRIDDDCVAEHDCLSQLAYRVQNDVGAIAPLVLMPNPNPVPKGLMNSIRNLNQPNVQWFIWEGQREAEHLYSCFLYRKGLSHYDLTLSNKAHREETIFSHSIKRLGKRLLVNGDARVWHFRKESGGIRSDNRQEDYDHDEKIFQAYLNLWGVSQDDRKFVVLDSGLGDHWAFKHILPEIKKKHKNVVIAACFPEVFQDEGVELISIAEAKLIFGNIDAFQIYKAMWDWNWKGSLMNAFKKLYL